MEEWQTSWNNSIGNKLLDIKPTIGEYQSVDRNFRKEEVVLARLRLGYTRVTHSYLLQGEEQPHCVGCDAPFTVRHFLLECATLHLLTRPLGPRVCVRTEYMCLHGALCPISFNLICTITTLRKNV